MGDAFLDNSGGGLLNDLATEAQAFVTAYNNAEATRAATTPASRSALDTEESNYATAIGLAQATLADQNADAYATFAEAQNADWQNYSADLETASKDRREAQSLAYADYQLNHAQAEYAAIQADTSATPEDEAIAHGQLQWILSLHTLGNSNSPYMTYITAQQDAYGTYEATVAAARSSADRAVAGETTANSTPEVLTGGPTFNASEHATSQDYEDLVSAASQARQTAATTDEQNIRSTQLQPATQSWLTSTTAEDGIRRTAVMSAHLGHAHSLFVASRDYQAGLAPYSGANPLPTMNLGQRDGAFTTADNDLAFSHVGNDADWRIPTASHHQTYATALATAERDSQINAAVRNDVYAQAIAEADRKLQTWTHVVDLWYMGEVNDAEKTKQESLALAQADWRDALYQANVDAWTTVDADVSLPWTGFKVDEATAQQAAWQDRRGMAVGVIPDTSGGYRLKWLEMQSQIIQSEHSYQTQLIAAYDSLITGSPGVTGVIEARYDQAIAASAAALSSATAYANAYHQFAVDSAEAEADWQVASTHEELEAAGGPTVPGSQSSVNADFIAAIEGFQATFQDDIDDYDRAQISGPGTAGVAAVGDQSEAQRVYVNTVNNARTGRNNTQQLARTVYEAGYLEKLDALYSDTGGFLGSTATPWHQHLAEVTAAERERFVDQPVSIPSTMIVPAPVSAANLNGQALAELARAATDNEARRVYDNSVDDARKDLADDRAQASLDDALDEFDQAIIDRDAEAPAPEPVQLPELLKYQPREDEPTAPTYELYEPGTIWGDRDWFEQGFNPAADPPSEGSTSEPSSGGASADYLLNTLRGARDEYGDFDFTVDITYYDASSSGEPDTSYRDGPYMQQVPASILGKVRDQKSWDQANLPGTSTYTPSNGTTPWFQASPAADYPGVFTPNPTTAGATLPVYTPPGSPPPPMSFLGLPGLNVAPVMTALVPLLMNEANDPQVTDGETSETADATAPTNGSTPGEAPKAPLEDEVEAGLEDIRQQVTSIMETEIAQFNVNMPAFVASLLDGSSDSSEGAFVIVIVIAGDDDLSELGIPPETLEYLRLKSEIEEVERRRAEMQEKYEQQYGNFFAELAAYSQNQTGTIRRGDGLLSEYLRLGEQLERLHDRIEMIGNPLLTMLGTNDLQKIDPAKVKDLINGGGLRVDDVVFLPLPDGRIAVLRPVYDQVYIPAFSGPGGTFVNGELTHWKVVEILGKEYRLDLAVETFVDDVNELKAANDYAMGMIAVGTLAEVLASFIPGPGEALDFITVTDPDQPTWVRTIAGGSLVLGVLTIGLSPNVGVVVRNVDEVADLAKGAGNATEAAASLPRHGIGEPILFGQRRIDPTFSIDPKFPLTSGRSLADVVADLRKGKLTPDDLPLSAFRHPETGNLVSINTRTRAVLAEAGLEPTKVTIVDLSSLTKKKRKDLLKRLSEPLVIDSPLPGHRVPVTPSMGNLNIMSRPDGTLYIIVIPG